MYRIRYSPHDPTLKDPGDFNKMVNDIQDKFRIQVDEKVDVDLR